MSAVMAGRRRPVSKFTRAFLLFAVPSAVILVVLNLYPLFFAVWQSLNNGDLAYIHPFVGLMNYGRALVDPQFWSAALFTLIFTVVGVFGSWAVGLGLALLLRTRIPFAGLWRALLMLPWVLSSASALSWLTAVGDQHALVPTLLRAVGFGNVQFLLDPIPNMVLVCAFRLWLGIPFMLMLMSSALASVDSRVYEAARVDGASGW